MSEGTVFPPPFLATLCHFPYRKEAPTRPTPISEASKSGLGGPGRPSSQRQSSKVFALLAFSEILSQYPRSAFRGSAGVARRSQQQFATQTLRVNCARYRQNAGKNAPKSLFCRLRRDKDLFSFSAFRGRNREGANREKLTVKKIISITRCFFTVYVPYKQCKTLRKP